MTSSADSVGISLAESEMLLSSNANSKPSRPSRRDQVEKQGFLSILESLTFSSRIPYPQKVSERGPCFGLFYIESYGGGYLARTGKSGSNMSAKQLNFTDLLTSMLVNK
ncbi:hypothetical protein OUZ56_005297 [Daphnia magna]|uniref:Uncharacterized protein n=1 Tax=Daphnia magna TaxID=35525 RepID=A0ABQ9YSE9_9CRUS|nr:hypothetical protein OUZ56_005297 [Daphnia magna]